MTKKILLGFSTLAMATAFAASSYRVTLFDSGTLAGKELKAGDYKLELKDSGIVLKGNKVATEAPAKVEESDKKFNTTTVRYNDRREIQEICIGGTNKKVVVAATPTSGTAGKQTLE